MSYISLRPDNENCHRQNELDAEACCVAVHGRRHEDCGRWEVEFITGLQSKFTKPIAGKRRWVFCFIGKHRRAGQRS